MRCTLRKKNKKKRIRTNTIKKKGGTREEGGIVNDKTTKDVYRKLMFLDNELNKFTPLDYVNNDEKVTDTMNNINEYFKKQKEQKEQTDQYKIKISLFKNNETYRETVYNIINQLIEECIKAIESYEVVGDSSIFDGNNKKEQYNKLRALFGFGKNKDKSKPKHIYKVEDDKLLSDIQNIDFSIFKNTNPNKENKEKDKQIMKLERNIYELIMSTKPTTEIINSLGFSDELMHRIFQNYIDTGKEYIELMEKYQINDFFNDSLPYFNDNLSNDDLSNDDLYIYNEHNRVIMFIKDRVRTNKDISGNDMNDANRQNHIRQFEVAKKIAESSASYNKMTYFFNVLENYNNMLTLLNRYYNIHNPSNKIDDSDHYNIIYKMYEFITSIQQIYSNKSNRKRNNTNFNLKSENRDNNNSKEDDLFNILKNEALTQQDFYLPYLNKMYIMVNNISKKKQCSIIEKINKNPIIPIPLKIEIEYSNNLETILKREISSYKNTIQLQRNDYSNIDDLNRSTTIFGELSNYLEELRTTDNSNCPKQPRKTQ